jgi:hypothetical protein
MKKKLNGNLGKKSLKNSIKRMEEGSMDLIFMRNVTLLNFCLDWTYLVGVGIPRSDNEW